MSRYELLLFVHVLAAAAWFGAALFSFALLEFAGRARDTAIVVRVGEYENRLANFLFIPAALATLIAGVALVFEGPWSFREDAWVTTGLVLFVAIFVLGLALFVPAGKRLHELAQSGAPKSDIESQVGRLRLLSRIDVVLLAVVIFLMTTKPF